ncbi:MAG: transposase [bacterium]|jgi:putative transposase|nr:transposase [bacterium]
MENHGDQAHNHAGHDVNYRRWRIPGGTYFFTVVTQDRRPLLLHFYERLLRSIAWTQQRRPFELDAFVVLPDHLHTMWTLPPGDTDYSSRWLWIKRRFSEGLPGGVLNASRIKKGERGIWQRRFWEHSIRDEQDWRAHLDFIHADPVKHGQVRAPRDWPFSSFATWVDLGCYPAEWDGRHALEREGVGQE